MQFKHPEVLYLLALLIVPILVHLFQLQKFVKVPFTNVDFLQKLVQETRKSSRIKKWLILGTRMLLLTCLIFAFSQPYFGSKKENDRKQAYIYLDNSLSTNTKGKKGNLLQVAARELIENSTDNTTYTLETNNNVHKDISAKELKDVLFKIENTAETKNIKDILLKVKENQRNVSAKNHENILVSDFQNTSEKTFNTFDASTVLVPLSAELRENLSIDSIYVRKETPEGPIIAIRVKNQGAAKKNIPIALYSKENLVNKQTFDISKDAEKTVTFPMGKSNDFFGKITLSYEDAFRFDNTSFFILNKNPRIKILSIGKEADFLTKIFTAEEFDYQHTTLQNLNYNTINNQNLIITNELVRIPKPLQNSLVEFTKNGGNLTVIPSVTSDVASYNTLFNEFKIGSITTKKTDSIKITDINFNHPIFRNVFKEKITNFQYPLSYSYFETNFPMRSNILALENKQPFICDCTLSGAKLFWVAGALDKENSNFITSPIVVPIFYNMAKESMKRSELYYTIGIKNTIDLQRNIDTDKVVSIRNSQRNFIPLQQNFQNKTRITTIERPVEAGFNAIVFKEDTIQTVAYNYDKKESLLAFLDTEKVTKDKKNLVVKNSVENAMQSINEKNEVQWLWKWFLILSIVSLFLEILILKFFKP
ncbi:BatA domain-containing protein [Tenacibaculum sp. SG-28]|uniref:BatA domain-containing protein n=1 Tax=Tenacibaculum sp. SG-28 TaxID=754426 RepID=UPI000CF3CDF1|nr:BatA domain-containing protein [Tenacibaculum sp. SG-28]PQJ19697.1 hypothetical protein BSU00_12065 [Tenacibaculum sp. SG-28]